MKIWTLGVIMVLLIGAFAGIAGASRANSSFSPTEIWTNSVNYGKMSTVSAMDSNGDNLAEVLVEEENYTDNSYHIVLLNGADGTILNETMFTDVGYSDTGDDVGIDGTLFGETELGNNGVPNWEHHFMVFGNHSNNKRVSVYSIDYPAMENTSYRGIDIPSQISYGSLSATVSFYDWIFHVVDINGKPYMVYFGIYSGSTLVGAVYETQVIVLNETLSVMWERNETAIGTSGVVPIGIDLIGFQDRGFNGDYPSILFVNLTSNPGNTNLTSYDTLTGNEIWNIVLPGYTHVYDPINFFHAVENLGTYIFDYNRDNKTDIVFSTFNSTSLHLNFVNSSGKWLGYYNTSASNVTVLAAQTDMRVAQFHREVKSIDVNGDGNGEVFFIDNNTKVVCWDIAHNTSVWTLPLINQSYAYSPELSTNDLNGDGTWDIYLIGMNESNANGVKVKKVNLTAVDAKSGSEMWTKYYDDAIGGFPGMGVIKEISDMNGDGLQDSLLIQGYYNDGTELYVNVSGISGNGDTLWTVKVSPGVNSTDYQNWSKDSGIVGDINGDGYGDVIVKLYYDNGSGVNTYIRILSGKDGSMMWEGEVINDTVDADISAFTTEHTVTSWNQFDYNQDGVNNELIITTSDTVQIYAVTQAVPEFNGAIFLVGIIIPAVIVLLRRKH